MSKLEVNAVEPQCGTNLTLGASGDTIIIPSGATISNQGTAAGFGSTGEVSWDTTKKTTGFTAVSGVGYFCDTNSAAFTVTLPATPSAGNVVAVSDYTGTFATNNLTIGRNGSNINGAASDYAIYQNNTTAQFIYVDATEGWRLVFTGASSDLASNFILATGGCISYCGNCKIHTFTGPGTFCVSATGLTSANNEISYIVVAGGGGGGQCVGGGGGAGGFREDKSPITPYTASPLDGAGPITVTATAYPITVGGGGAGSANACVKGCNGSNSIFSTITSAGGGGGGTYNPSPIKDGAPGGSGGGGAGYVLVTTGGTGNTPPTSPPQGNAGGNSPTPCIQKTGGGGGGATAVGANENAPQTSYASGGAGAASSISASPVTYSTGGRGAGDQSPSPQSGSSNTGNGGDGGGAPPGAGSSGGSGIVIIRYKYQ
jgi:hypothetical protein